MLENFIYAKQKSLFEEALNNGEVLDEAIVFIEDTKEIWNHGTYFDGSTINLKTINGESVLGEGDIVIEGGAKVYTLNWDGESESVTLSQEECDNIVEADIVVLNIGGIYHVPVVIIDFGEEFGVCGLVGRLNFQGTEIIVNVLIDISTKIATITMEQQDIPTKTSQLENDSNFVSSDGLKTINGESIVGSGDIVISSGSSSGSGAYAEVSHGTSDTTFTLTPNTFHVWDEVASLDLSLGAETSGVANEYLFQFTSGDTATTLSLPSDIKWANEPTITENKIYQISVLKGLASVLEFSVLSSVMPIRLTIVRASVTEPSVNPNASKLYAELMYLSEGTGTGTIPEGMLSLYIIDDNEIFVSTATLTSYKKSTYSIPGIILWTFSTIDHILQEDGTIAIYDWD